MLNAHTAALLLTGTILIAATNCAGARVVRVDTNASLSATPYTLSLGDDSGFSFRSVSDGVGGYDLRLTTQRHAAPARAHVEP